MSSFKIQQPLPSKHESVTVSTVAIGLTAANYHYESTSTRQVQMAQTALITVETDAIRWTCDGTVPTAAVGHKAAVDDVLTLEGFDAIRLFKAIRVTTDATLKVSYFGG